ncbi:hypothetical protein B0T17DRAFT_52753 [Bombardia bombarda]|uniref:Malate dehydrogenase n=1 Tax=Bombardia bombarda TaxID=252184 RepID=A0AA39XKI8_9PEZI|nr:hypothetical protein B0T17DRAFT_52753 [Bombardia bombarda]
MHASALLVSALSTAVFAAPVTPNLNTDAATPVRLDVISDYFNLLAGKVQQSKLLTMAPVCDLSKAYLPAAPTPLPAPSAGLTLKHVAIGRGTQNYTCDVNNATAVPAAVGAVATLFNASCLTTVYPDLAQKLAAASVQFNLTQAFGLAPGNLVASGNHFFSNNTTPVFDLDSTPFWKLGQIPCNKTHATPAPADAVKGQQGELAVPWLKLAARTGATGGLQEVYRVNTVGGSAPATCKGLSATFQVQYAAE